MTDWSNEQECLEAVRKDIWNLQYVENQTEEMCIEAIEKDTSALQYIKNQTEELIKKEVQRKFKSELNNIWKHLQKLYDRVVALEK